MPTSMSDYRPLDILLPSLVLWSQNLKPTRPFLTAHFSPLVLFCCHFPPFSFPRPISQHFRCYSTVFSRSFAVDSHPQIEAILPFSLPFRSLVLLTLFYFYKRIYFLCIASNRNVSRFPESGGTEWLSASLPATTTFFLSNLEGGVLRLTHSPVSATSRLDPYTRPPCVSLGVGMTWHPLSPHVWPRRSIHHIAARRIALPHLCCLGRSTIKALHYTRTP
jgi:hypothetical protein